MKEKSVNGILQMLRYLEERRFGDKIQLKNINAKVTGFVIM